ncbi:hypothetical protein [Faecalibacterium prausnitzii]|uniref:hypothetical protein n=1 Tax=Faecalibacterium prausnitzii TaxID=853 RepID=UPI0012DE2DF0|nr:hypothetical protein [Faecalibacterium prausnitzii]
MLEYHTFGTDAPVWAIFSANLPPFGMIWGMIGSKGMENVIDFRKFYDIITAFPRVLGENTMPSASCPPLRQHCAGCVGCGFLQSKRKND